MSLAAWVEHFIAEASVLPHISTAPHRFGGVEFRLGRVEVGHIHRYGMVDIPFTRAIRQALVTAGQAEPHHLLADSGWISFYLRQAQDVADGLALLHLSYWQKLSRRQPLPATALADLPFDAAILSAAFPTRPHPEE